MKEVARCLATAILALAFVLSGFLHNTVHHEHGHAATDGVFWGQLHSALRHDEKDLAVAPVSACITVVFLALSLLVAIITFVPEFVLYLQPDRGRYLTRGIAHYRRFV